MAPSIRARRRPAVGFLLVVLAVALGIVVPGAAYADEIRDRQWHLDFLGIPEAHQITRGEAVTAAVLDSGVDYRHPDLEGALLEGNSFAGGREDGWEDATGHGTEMASLIAARGHGQRGNDGVLGIAPAARILPVRTTSGGYRDSRGLEQGIEWAVDRGADILSISQAYLDDPEIEEAVGYAIAQGAVIVAGVGNTGRGDSEVMAPARYSGVIAVSGTDQDGNFTEASVSGPQVVLSAPATDIVTGASGERGRYSIGTGTSASTAIVAGVAALVMSEYPDLDAANVIQRLIATADDRGPDGRDSQYGFGIVDPVAALTEDVPRVDANPLIKPPASSKKAAKTNDPAGIGIGPAGYGLIAVGVLGVLALAVVGLIAVSRRRRVTVGPPPTGMGVHGQVRPPAPPQDSRPPPW